jgi:hypothetical protein
VLGPGVREALGAGRPLNLNRAHWTRIESAVGRELPEDFKEFVNRYGAGTIDGELQVGDVESIELYMDSFGAPAKLSREHGEIPADVAIWPERSGIMFWATSASGDIAYLRPVEHDDWHVCVLTESGDWTEIETSFSRFMEQLIVDPESCPFGLKWSATSSPRWRQ